jgi:hypothetical protein
MKRRRLDPQPNVAGDVEGLRDKALPLPCADGGVAWSRSFSGICGLLSMPVPSLGRYVRPATALLVALMLVQPRNFPAAGSWTRTIELITWRGMNYQRRPLLKLKRRGWLRSLLMLSMSLVLEMLKFITRGCQVSRYSEPVDWMALTENARFAKSCSAF